MKILDFVEKHFGLVISGGLVLGLVFGKFIPANNELAFEMMDWAIIFGLFILLFVSMLKINLLNFFKDLKCGKSAFFLIAHKLVIVPVVVFFISLALPVEYRPGLLLLAAVPAAVAMPGLMVLFKGDVKAGFIVSVVTNLLVPFTLPIIFYYTLGSEVDFDVSSMFFFLLAMVFIPLLLALPLQIYAKDFCKKIAKHASAIISIDIFFFLIAVIAPFSNDILHNWIVSLISLALVVVLALFFHLAGYLPFITSTKENKIAGIIAIAYANTGLGIVLASQYFDGTTVLITVLYEFAWAIGLFLLQISLRTCK